jgi:hypothetical protein
LPGIITKGYAPIGKGLPAGLDSGSILIQPSNAQMIAIPKENAKIYEDFIQVIETNYGVSASDLFEAINAYPSTPSQDNEFLSFIPNVTNPASKHNFNLVMDDNGSKEILGFWVLTKDYINNGILTEVIQYDWEI